MNSIYYVIEDFTSRHALRPEYTWYLTAYDASTHGRLNQVPAFKRGDELPPGIEGVDFVIYSLI